MRRICILCGKSSEIDNFCSDCWLKTRELFNIEDFEIIVCECGSYYYKGEWRRFEDLDELIKQLTRSRIETENEIVGVDIFLKKAGNVYTVTIKAKGYIKPCNKIKVEEKTIRVRVRWRKCDRCKKVLSNYYEAIFQIRGFEVPEEIANMLSDYISKIKEQKNGFDIYLIDKKIAKKAIKRFKELGFKIKVSYEYVGMKKGKKLYRDIYSIAR